MNRGLAASRGRHEIRAIRVTRRHAKHCLNTKFEIARGRFRPQAFGMLIVHVHVRVKAECVDAFREATVENAANSVREPGIALFDVVQENEDPARFVLVEVYRDEAAPAAHKETAHYAKWRDTVAPMMAEPRRSVKYTNVFPEAGGW